MTITADSVLTADSVRALGEALRLAARSPDLEHPDYTEALREIAARMFWIVETSGQPDLLRAWGQIETALTPLWQPTTPPARTGGGPPGTPAHRPLRAV